jgi:hypothetical protein
VIQAFVRPLSLQHAAAKSKYSIFAANHQPVQKTRLEWNE